MKFFEDYQDDAQCRRQHNIFYSFLCVRMRVSLTLSRSLSKNNIYLFYFIWLLIKLILFSVARLLLPFAKCRVNDNDVEHRPNNKKNAVECRQRKKTTMTTLLVITKWKSNGKSLCRQSKAFRIGVVCLYAVDLFGSLSRRQYSM